MSSYQIKSTPFFRRMVSRSKQNGQLQKLKEEYDRIKEFNDNALEMRMKQVRLKRLFQEIEEIKENEIRKRRMAQERARERAAYIESNKNSFHEQRIREFMRTQGMDDDLSTNSSIRPVKRPLKRPKRQERKTTMKSNRGRASGSPSGTAMTTSSYLNVGAGVGMKLQWNAADESASKARVIRRLNYGNQISSWNMQKMLTNNLNKEMNDSLRKKRNQRPSKLQYLISSKPSSSATDRVKKYSSSTGRNGLTTAATNQTRGSTQPTAGGGRKGKTVKIKTPTQSPFELSSSEQLSRLKDEEDDAGESNDGSSSSEAMHHRYPPVQPTRSKENASTMERRLNAQRRWRKLALMLQKRQDNNQNFNKALKTLQKCSSDLEYQLRSISNATNLPEAAIPALRVECRNCASDDDEDEIIESDLSQDDDVLLSSQKYSQLESNSSKTITPNFQLEAIPSTSAAAAAAAAGAAVTASSPEIADEEKAFDLSPMNTTTFNDQVQSMINKYLPFSMDAVKSEIADYSSKRLRQAFEEQYKFN